MCIFENLAYCTYMHMHSLVASASRACACSGAKLISLRICACAGTAGALRRRSLMRDPFVLTKVFKNSHNSPFTTTAARAPISCQYWGKKARSGTYSLEASVIGHRIEVFISLRCHWLIDFCSLVILHASLRSTMLQHGQSALLRYLSTANLSAARISALQHVLSNTSSVTKSTLLAHCSPRIVHLHYGLRTRLVSIHVVHSSMHVVLPCITSKHVILPSWCSCQKTCRRLRIWHTANGTFSPDSPLLV
jgi:hypothetical protein